MNGRVYDPTIGRFISPDPTNGSGLNRYTYVGNNPLTFTDPTGYCFLGCFWQPKKAVHLVGDAAEDLAQGVGHVADEVGSHWQVVAAAAAAYFTFGATAAAGWSWAEIGAASGAAAGATYNGTTGGSIWQGAVQGGLIGGGIGGLAGGAYTAYTATQGGGWWGLAKFAGNQYFHQVASNELARVAARNGMSLGRLDLYLLAFSELGNAIPGIGSRFDAANMNMRGWLNRGGFGLPFDIADTLLEYQGIPSASSLDYIFSSYRGMALEGHSLGSIGVNNLVGWGFAPSGSRLYALPFLNVATDGTTLTISGGDLVNGFFFGKALNPDATLKWGPFLGHSDCEVYQQCF